MTKITDTLMKRASDYLKKQFKDLLVKGVQRRIQIFIRALFFSITGAFIAFIGILFIGLGIIELLGYYMPQWLSWIIVGIILMLIGVILALLAIQKLR